MLVRRRRPRIVQLGLAAVGMQTGILAAAVVVPRVRHEFLDVRLRVEVDLLDVGEIAAQNRAARHQEGLRVRAALGRKITVGHEVADALAVAGLEPVLVKRGDRQHVRQIDLVDEASHLLDDRGHLLQADHVDRGGAGSRRRHER